MHAFGIWPIALMLVMTRVSSFLVASPFLGTGVVPNTVKFGVSLTLSLFLLPNYLDYVGEMKTGATVVIAAASEALIGAMLGFWLRLVFLPVKTAAAYIGQELGFTLGQVTESTSNNATSEVGVFFDSVALALFWVTNCHHGTLKALAYSTQFPDQTDFPMPTSTEAAALVCEALRAGFDIVSPLGAILFVILIGLMVLMRTWSHINLFSFGTAARLFAGWLGFLVTGPFIISKIALVLRVGVHAFNSAITGT